jgi:hypothetical protein
MGVKHLRLRGTVASRSDASALIREPGDAVLVERGHPRLLVMQCPCGCGEEYPVNVDRKAGKAWRLYRRQGSITLYPSVWRDTGCESHFVIWNNSIYLFGGDADWLGERGAETNPDRVYAALSQTFQSISDIADGLDALPWDVLVACRRLVRTGKAVEGASNQRGYFRKLT